MINMKGCGDMKFRRTLCCLLAGAILSVPLLTGCNNGKKETSSVSQTSAVTSADSSAEKSDVSDEKSTITPAMWKAEDNSGHYCYLFGTVHAADDSANIMPDYFEKAYLDSDAIGVEADVTTIKDHISEETYNGINEVMKNNANSYFEHMYDMFTPVAWTSIFEGEILTKCGLDTNKGIDVNAIKRAKSDSKEVIELESIEYQAQMFERISDKAGELILVPYTTQEGFDQQVAEMKQLYDDWKYGRPIENNINESQLAELDEEIRKAIEYYNDEMLVKRNAAMADKISEYLNDGKKVLVMVGAAHFYGDDGIVKLMESKGFKVTSLSA